MFEHFRRFPAREAVSVSWRLCVFLLFASALTVIASMQ
jgi:hypothetical protein